MVIEVSYDNLLRYKGLVYSYIKGYGLCIIFFFKFMVRQVNFLNFVIFQDLF